MPKILLVEDNEMNRDMLSRRLARKGYEVVCAVDGAVGVAMASSEAPDLILMDMNLPVMDGWEATRKLKADEATLDCVRCGLAMIEAARKLPCEWSLRVGVHCGPVVAGIVGRQKYQYDIWGDTVNIASRVQSEAPVGVLCVSAETWRLVGPRCEGRSLGLREMKGKGAQELFHVESIRD